jgi:hypothetical protein
MDLFAPEKPSVILPKTTILRLYGNPKEKISKLNTNTFLERFGQRAINEGLKILD